jgi:hypothetical protein
MHLAANPVAGSILRENDVFVVGLRPGDSASSVAALYTIGGADYAEAIRQYNHWDWGATEYVMDRAKLAIIPQEWMRQSYIDRFGLYQPVVQPVVDAAQAVAATAAKVGTTLKWSAIIGGLLVATILVRKALK